MQNYNDTYGSDSITSTGNYSLDFSTYNQQPTLTHVKQRSVKSRLRKISFKVKNYLNMKFTKSFRNNAKKTKSDTTYLENHIKNKGLSIPSIYYCHHKLSQNNECDIEHTKEVCRRLLRRIANLKKFKYNFTDVSYTNINRLNELLNLFENHEELNSEVLRLFVKGIYFLWKEYKQEKKSRRKIISKKNTKHNTQISTNHQRIVYKMADSLVLPKNEYLTDHNYNSNIEWVSETGDTTNVEKKRKRKQPYGRFETNIVKQTLDKKNVSKQIRNYSKLRQSKLSGGQNFTNFEIGSKNQIIENTDMEIYITQIKNKLEKTIALLRTANSGSTKPRHSVLEKPKISSEDISYGTLSQNEMNINVEQKNSNPKPCKMHTQLKSPRLHTQSNYTNQANKKLKPLKNKGDFFGNNSYLHTISKLRNEEEPVRDKMVLERKELISFYSYNSRRISYKSFHTFLMEDMLVFSEYEHDIQIGNCYYYYINQNRKHFNNTSEAQLIKPNHDNWLYSDLNNSSALTDNCESENTEMSRTSTSIKPHTRITSQLSELEDYSELTDTSDKVSRGTSKKQTPCYKLEKANSDRVCFHKGLSESEENPIKKKGHRLREIFNPDIPLPPEPSSSESKTELEEMSHSDLKQDSYQEKCIEWLKSNRNHQNQNSNTLQTPLVNKINAHKSISKLDLLRSRRMSKVMNKLDDNFCHDKKCSEASSEDAVDLLDKNFPPFNNKNGDIMFFQNKILRNKIMNAKKSDKSSNYMTDVFKEKTTQTSNQEYESVNKKLTFKQEEKIFANSRSTLPPSSANSVTRDASRKPQHELIEIKQSNNDCFQNSNMVIPQKQNTYFVWTDVNRVKYQQEIEMQEVIKLGTYNITHSEISMEQYDKNHEYGTNSVCKGLSSLERHASLKGQRERFKLSTSEVLDSGIFEIQDVKGPVLSDDDRTSIDQHKEVEKEQSEVLCTDAKVVLHCACPSPVTATKANNSEILLKNQTRNLEKPLCRNEHLTNFSALNSPKCHNYDNSVTTNSEIAETCQNEILHSENSYSEECKEAYFCMLKTNRLKLTQQDSDINEFNDSEDTKQYTNNYRTSQYDAYSLDESLQIMLNQEPPKMTKPNEIVTARINREKKLVDANINTYYPTEESDLENCISNRNIHSDETVLAKNTSEKLLVDVELNIANTKYTTKESDEDNCASNYTGHSDEIVLVDITTKNQQVDAEIEITNTNYTSEEPDKDNCAANNTIHSDEIVLVDDNRSQNRLLDAESEITNTKYTTEESDEDNCSSISSIHSDEIVLVDIRSKKQVLDAESDIANKRCTTDESDEENCASNNSIHSDEIFLAENGSKKELVDAEPNITNTKHTSKESDIDNCTTYNTINPDEIVILDIRSKNQLVDRSVITNRMYTKEESNLDNYASNRNNHLEEGLVDTHSLIRPLAHGYCDHIIRTNQLTVASQLTQIDFQCRTSNLKCQTIVHININGRTRMQATKNLKMNTMLRKYNKLIKKFKGKINNFAYKSQAHKQIDQEACNKFEQMIQTEEQTPFITDQQIQTVEIIKNVNDESIQSEEINTQTCDKNIQTEHEATLSDNDSQTMEELVFTIEKGEQTEENNKGQNDKSIQTDEISDCSSEKIVQTDTITLLLVEESTQTEDTCIHTEDQNIQTVKIMVITNEHIAQTEPTINNVNEQMIQTEEKHVPVSAQSIQTEEQSTNICDESIQTEAVIVVEAEQMIQTETIGISIGEQTEEVVKTARDQFTITNEITNNCEQSMQTVDIKLESNDQYVQTLTVKVDKVVQTEEGPMFFDEQLTQTEQVVLTQQTYVLETLPTLKSNFGELNSRGGVNDVDNESSQSCEDRVIGNIDMESANVSPIRTCVESEIEYADTIEDSMSDDKLELEEDMMEQDTKMNLLVNDCNPEFNVDSQNYETQLTNEEFDSINPNKINTSVLNVNEEMLICKNFQVETKTNRKTGLESEIKDTETFDTLTNVIINSEYEEHGNQCLDHFLTPTLEETIKAQMGNIKFAMKKKQKKHYTRPCSLILNSKYRPLLPSLFKNRRRKYNKINPVTDSLRNYNKDTTRNRETLTDIKNIDYKDNSNISLLMALPTSDPDVRQDEIVELQQQSFNAQKLHWQNLDDHEEYQSDESKNKCQKMKHYSRPCSKVIQTPQTHILQISPIPNLNSGKINSSNVGGVDGVDDNETCQSCEERVIDNIGIESSVSPIMTCVESKIEYADTIEDSLSNDILEREDNMKEKETKRNLLVIKDDKLDRNVDSQKCETQSNNEEFDNINSNKILISLLNVNEEMKINRMTDLQPKNEISINTLKNVVTDSEYEEDGHQCLDHFLTPTLEETMKTQMGNLNFAMKKKHQKHYTRPCSLILNSKYRPLLPNLLKNRRRKYNKISPVSDSLRNYNKDTTKIMDKTKNRDKLTDMKNIDYKASSNISLLMALPTSDRDEKQNEIVEPQPESFTADKLHWKDVDDHEEYPTTGCKNKRKKIKRYSRPCLKVCKLKLQSDPLTRFTPNNSYLKSKSAVDCDAIIKNKNLSRYEQKLKDKCKCRSSCSLPPENISTSSINVWDYFTRSPYKINYEGDYIENILNSSSQSNKANDSVWVSKLPESEEDKCLEDIGDIYYFPQPSKNIRSDEESIVSIPYLKSASDLSASESSDEETCENPQTNALFDKTLPSLPASPKKIQVIQAWTENGTNIKIKNKQKKKLVEQHVPKDRLMDEEYGSQKKESKKFDDIVVEDLSSQSFDITTHLKAHHIKVSNNEQKSEYSQKNKTLESSMENINKHEKLRNVPQKFDDLIIEDLTTQTFDSTVIGLKPRSFEINKSSMNDDYRIQDTSVTAQQLDPPLKSKTDISSVLRDHDGIVWVKPLLPIDYGNRSTDDKTENEVFFSMQRSEDKSKDIGCSLMHLTHHEDASLKNTVKNDKDNKKMNALHKPCNINKCNSTPFDNPLSLKRPRILKMRSQMDLHNSNIPRRTELHSPFSTPVKCNSSSGLMNRNKEITLPSTINVFNSQPITKDSQIPIKQNTNARSSHNIISSTHSLSNMDIYSPCRTIQLKEKSISCLKKCKSCPEIYKRVKINMRKRSAKSVVNKKSLYQIFPISSEQQDSIKFNEYLQYLKKCYKVSYSADSESVDEDLAIMLEYARNKRRKTGKNDGKQEDHKIIKNVAACINWMNDVISDTDLPTPNEDTMNSITNEATILLEQQSNKGNIIVEKQDNTAVRGFAGNINVQNQVGTPVTENIYVEKQVSTTTGITRNIDVDKRVRALVTGITGNIVEQHCSTTLPVEDRDIERQRGENKDLQLARNISPAGQLKNFHQYF